MIHDEYVSYGIWGRIVNCAVIMSYMSDWMDW